VRVSESTDLLNFSHRFALADRLLLDAEAGGSSGPTGVQQHLYGGTGQVFDWERIPASMASTIVLSGGLNAENVAAAIQRVRPWAVDVSSGVEEVRGVKSMQRIREFIDAVKKEDARADAFE